MSRQKKYKMKAIPSAISEKGGFTAQFIGDGYSVDTRKEILPGIIKANGVQVGEGVAWDLIQAFLKECASRAAATGETVTVGSLITFGLAIRGWFANKDSKASKENVRVTATLLNDLRPTVAFSMSNDIDGATLMLVTTDATMLIERMRNKCGEAGSSLNFDAGATVKLTLSDGTELTHHVSFGE